jgi:MFS family permease
VNTFGAYQAYYENYLTDSSSSEISWIGTFQGFLLIIFGIIGGPIFDRGYFRALLATGIFLVVFGMMMTSLATTYWQIFLAQGLCVGLGASCLFLPSVAIVATYFSTKRALAIGISAAGGSTGSVIYSIIFHRLQSKVGASWATRVIGFIALCTLSISMMVMKTRISPPTHPRSLFDRTAFRSIYFVLFSVGLFLIFTGLYIPFFYVVIYAQRKIGITEDLTFYLLSVLNASSAAGRIIPGLLADKFGSLEIMTICAISAAILSYAWVAIQSLGGIVIFCLLYGFASGAVVSLPSSIVAEMVPDLQLLGTWMGMSFTFAGVGLLIGNPIAGVLINIEDNRFSHGFIFGATVVMAASVVFVLILLIRLTTSKASSER